MADRPPLVRGVTSNSLGGQAARFLLMTGLSAALTMGLPIFLHELLAAPPEQAVAIAFVIAYLVNFVILRSLVFVSGRSLWRDFLNFGLSSIAFRVAEYALFLGLYNLLHLYYVLALGITLVGSAIAKFFWYRTTMHGSGKGEAMAVEKVL